MESGPICMRTSFWTFDNFHVERFHTTLLPLFTKTVKLAAMLLGSKLFLWELNLSLVEKLHWPLA